MELIIDIPEERFRDIQRIAEVQLERNHFKTAEQIVANGTPLPKGHGRLLDEKEILASENHDGGWYDLADMPEYIAGVPAVIEADKAESEDKE